MNKSDSLRQRKNQHTPKNVLSKGDDRKIAVVMDRVVLHLNERFKLADLGYYLEYVRSIKLSELIGIIRGYDKQTEFATLAKQDSYIKPDGGILVSRKKEDEHYKRIALAVEMKHQGTNDKRIAEGKRKAIARQRHRTARKKSHRHTGNAPIRESNAIRLFRMGR